MSARLINSILVVVISIAALGCKRRVETQNYSEILALYLIPSSIYKNGEPFKPADVGNMLTALKESSDPNTKIYILSSKTAFVPETDSLQSFINEETARFFGYRQSKFMASSRWITMRYIGDNPAGAGLEGEAQNVAQKESLGKENDSIPVVTAAWTTTKIMNDYFAPLLSSLPMGEQILRKFKIQGAYYSPAYVQKQDNKVFDNAFLAGLNTLQVEPSSCFVRPSGSNCTAPYMTTGHDPTVIGHEIGHAVFNYLREGKAFDGFQWIAVNEGFADYFSAAYFSEPVLGRIWQVGKIANPYLRKLTENVTAEEKKLLSEVHEFGVVWGSTLWRLRNRLINEVKASPREVDRTFLYAITFLGETDKIRLGDAGSALLKAAEALDHTLWKDLIRNELEIAKISLEPRISPESFKDFSGENGAAGNAASSLNKARQEKKVSFDCGVITQKTSGNIGIIFFLILPLLFPVINVRRKKE